MGYVSNLESYENLHKAQIVQVFLMLKIVFHKEWCRAIKNLIIDLVKYLTNSVVLFYQFTGVF